MTHVVQIAVDAYAVEVEHIGRPDLDSANLLVTVT
jgi:hypothetical protein